MAVDNNKVPSWGEIQSNVTEVNGTTGGGVPWTYKWFKMGRLVYVSGRINSIGTTDEVELVTITLTSLPIPIMQTGVTTSVGIDVACEALIRHSSNNAVLYCFLKSVGTNSTSVDWNCCYMTNE